MRLEGLISASGLVTVQPGAILETTEDIGNDLIRAGIARLVSDRPIETMSLDQPARGKRMTRRRMETKL